MRVNAAVCESPGGDLTVEEVVLDEPGPHDVLVRVTAAGVCHTDYHYLAGDLQAHVPGHEGAGTVEAAGSAVTSVAPGDPVCFLWRPRCGDCLFCLAGRPTLCQAAAVYASSGGLLDGKSRLHRSSGAPLHHLLGVSCFAEYSMVSERAIVQVPKDVPPQVAAITGCAVTREISAPLQPPGWGTAALRGNLCPAGAVIKQSAASPHLLRHEGRAVVFDSPEQYHAVCDDEALDVTPTT